MKKLVVVVGLFLMTFGVMADVPEVWYPEDGTWRNPAAPGRNFKIDVQDDILILNVFGYRSDGTAVWYQAAGPWTDYPVTQTKVFSAKLSEYENGQCVGCPYKKPVLVGPNGGSITITFTGISKANVNWEGDKFSIERSSVVVGNPPYNWLGTWLVAFEIIGSHSDLWQIITYAGKTNTPGSLGVVLGIAEYDDLVGIECYGGQDAGSLDGQCLAIVGDPDTQEIKDIYVISKSGVNNGSGRWHSDNPDQYDYPAWFRRIAGETDTLNNYQATSAAISAKQDIARSMRMTVIDTELDQSVQSLTASEPIIPMAANSLRAKLLQNGL